MHKCFELTLWGFGHTLGSGIPGSCDVSLCFELALCGGFGRTLRCGIPGSRDVSLCFELMLCGGFGRTLRSGIPGSHDVSLWLGVAFSWWMSDAEHLFLCLMVIHFSSLEKMSTSYSAHFLIRLFVFWYWIVWVVNVFWMLIPYQSYHLQNYSSIQ